MCLWFAGGGWRRFAVAGSPPNDGLGLLQHSLPVPQSKPDTGATFSMLGFDGQVRPCRGKQRQPASPMM
jgi:hypothetical protein